MDGWQAVNFSMYFFITWTFLADFVPKILHILAIELGLSVFLSLSLSEDVISSPLSEHSPRTFFC
jgi:hypothetical protein